MRNLHNVPIPSNTSKTHHTYPLSNHRGLTPACNPPVTTKSAPVVNPPASLNNNATKGVKSLGCPILLAGGEL
jgi:hypothetical protein